MENNVFARMDLVTKNCALCGEMANISFGKTLCDDCRDEMESEYELKNQDFPELPY